jgi:hypothetical protein
LRVIEVAVVLQPYDVVGFLEPGSKFVVQVRAGSDP